MLEQILNTDDLATPELIGTIASAAIVIAIALLVFTTGLSWMRAAVNAWKTDEGVAQIQNIQEFFRKVALVVIIVNYTLISDLIITVVNFTIDAVTVEDDEHDAAKDKLDAYVNLYAHYAHYFNLLEDWQTAPPDKKSAAEDILEKRYPNKIPSMYPVSTGIFDEISLSIERSMVVMGTDISLGFSSFLLWIGWGMGVVFKFFFAILFQVLLALLPLSLAFSIPESFKNSYSTLIRRVLNVGIAFVVLELLEQFTINVYEDLVVKCADLFMQGASGNANVAEFDEMLYFALPVFSIALIGLYSSSNWIASSVTGGGDGEGGIATKGMGMAIGGATAVTALAFGVKAAGKAAASKAGNFGSK